MIPSEDALIMAVRANLEAHWLYSLTSSQRDAWLDHWLTSPPQDISGHTYIVGSPVTMPEIQVEPQTAYAWSQCYAALRFQLDPLDDPDATTTPAPIVAGAVRSAGIFTVDIENDDASTTDRPIIIFASLPIYVTVQRRDSYLRPVQWFTTRPMPTTFDIYSRYIERFGYLTGDIVYVRAASLDASQQLQPSAAGLSIEWT